MSDENELKPTQFRLSGQDLAGLDAIKEHIRDQDPIRREPSRSDALRYAVRETVKRIEAEKPTKRPRR